MHMPFRNLCDICCLDKSVADAAHRLMAHFGVLGATAAPPDSGTRTSRGVAYFVSHDLAPHVSQELEVRGPTRIIMRRKL